MKAVHGYNEKPLRITVSAEDKKFYLWIEQEGLEEGRETLSHLTLDELFTLYSEIQQAFKDQLGLK